MAKKKLTKKIHQREKYSRPKLYKGYYWLILHIDPYCGPDSWPGDGGYIISKDYWKSKMPDCVKIAIEEHTSDQPLKHTIAVNEKGYHYPTKRACSIDGAFSWFTSKNIPPLNADGKEIKSWRDLRRLWEIANTYDSFGNKIPLTQHDTFKKAMFSEEFYNGHCADIFHALESYLERQHKKNLEMLKTPAPPVRTIDWEFDEERHEVKCNKKEAVKLEPNLFSLFLYLHNTKPNNLVTGKAVAREFRIKEGQAKNRLNKLISFLNKKHEVLGLKEGEISKIFERVPDKKDHRKSKGIIFHLV